MAAAEASSLVDTRSGEQNRKFHAMLRDISRQVEWDGEMHDEAWWKFLVLGAAYGQHFVRNPFGEGFVCANKRRSSHLEVPQMSELIEQLNAFGAEKNVQWTDPDWQSFVAEGEHRCIS